MHNNKLLPEAPDYSPRMPRDHCEQNHLMALPVREETHTFSDYLGIFRKRAYLIASCAAVSTGIAILYCIFTSSLYTAETFLELKGYAPVLSNVQSETLFGSDTRRIEYQKTTVAKLKLISLGDEVLSKNNLAEECTDETTRDPSPPSDYLRPISDVPFRHPCGGSGPIESIYTSNNQTSPNKSMAPPGIFCPRCCVNCM